MLSIRRDVTPPAVTDPILLRIHDRLDVLDSQVQGLCSTVLTQDDYVDFRNREDAHIRREFQAQRYISERIDSNVLSLQRDVGLLKSNVDKRFATMEERFDNVDKRFATMEERFDNMDKRFASMEVRTKHMERVRFNSLANTVRAPITPVPKIQVDGSLSWPQYFPRTVWRFWCLKKQKGIKRLVELVEFYELEGYQYWSCPYQSDIDLESGSDSNSSSDIPSNLTRAEAVMQFPEAAHQALAATLGLDYYHMRKEISRYSDPQPSRPSKRPQRDVISVVSTKDKRVRIPLRRTSISTEKLVKGGYSLEPKSLPSEESEKVGWRVHSDVPEDLMKRVAAGDHVALMRAIEQGLVRLQPSRSERLKMSPRESKASSRDGKVAADADQEDDDRNLPDTIATEVLTQSWRPT